MSVALRSAVSEIVSGLARWTPAQMFASGEDGSLLDESIDAACFQNLTGTASDVGDVLGLIVDQKTEETFTETYASDFSAGVDGWTQSANASSTGNIDGIESLDNWLRVTAGGVGGQVISLKNSVLTVGKRYTTTLQVYVPASQTYIDGFRVQAGAAGAIVYNGSGMNGSVIDIDIAHYADDTSFRIYAYDGATSIINAAASGELFYVRAVTISESNLNSAFQTTSAAKPVRSVEPKTGIRNVLQGIGAPSEDMTNAAWIKSNFSASLSGDTIGEYPASRLTLSGGNITHYIYAPSIIPDTAIESCSAFLVDVSNLTTKAASIAFTNPASRSLFTWTGPQTITVGNAGATVGGYEIIGDYQALIYAYDNATRTGATSPFLFAGAYGNYSGDGEYLIATRAQVEFALAPTAYQKVTSKYDVSESGITPVYFIDGDGTDDYMKGSLPSADYQTGVMLFGVFRHKTGSISGNQTVIGLGDVGGGQAFDLLINSANNKIELFAKGNGAPTLSVTGPDLDANKHVFVLWSNGSTAYLRLDGTEYSAAYTLGAITLNQYGLLAYNRSAVGNFANARLSHAGILLRAPSITETRNVEKYLANMYGVTLS